MEGLLERGHTTRPDRAAIYGRSSGARTYYSTGQGCHLWKVFWSEDILLDRTGLPSMEGLLERGHTTRPDRAAIYGRSSGARTYYSTGQGCHLWKVFWSEDILLDRTGLPSMEGLLERGHTTRPDRAAIYGRSSGARTYYSTGQGCHLWKVFWSEDILHERTGLPSMEGLLERGHTTRTDRAAIYGRSSGAKTYYSTGQGCHLWKVFWSEDILLDRTGLPSMEGLLERGHTTRPDRAAIYGRSSGAKTYYSTGQGCHLWKVFWSEDILLDRTGRPSMEGLLERRHTTRPDRAAIYGRSSGAKTYYSNGQGGHLWKVFWSEDILLERTGLPSMEGLLERGHTTRPDRAAIYGRSSEARTYYSTGQGCHLWKVFWSKDILLDRTGLPSMEGLLERGHTTRPDRATIYGRSSGARTYYSTGQGCHLWKVFWSEDILLDRTRLPSMEGLLERGHTTRPDRAAIYGRSSGARTYYSTGQGCHLWKVFWSEDILLDRTGLPSMEGLLERGHTTRPDRAAIYGRSSGARTYYSTGQGCHLWKIF